MTKNTQRPHSNATLIRTIASSTAIETGEAVSDIEKRLLSGNCKFSHLKLTKRTQRNPTPENTSNTHYEITTMTKRTHNETIRSKYTARQYFKKLVGEGYTADYASSMVNAVFNGGE